MLEAVLGDPRRRRRVGTTRHALLFALCSAVGSLVPACSGNDSNENPGPGGSGGRSFDAGAGTNGSAGTAPSGGTAGSDGSAGSAGSGATGGSAGTSGTAGGDGSAGSGSSAGAAGTAGGDGSAGSGGTAGGDGSAAGGTAGDDGSAGSGGTAGGDGSAGVPGWDWNGIVGTGQSLAVGAQAPTLNATQQPYNNLKLSLGSRVVPPFDPTDTALSMVPLVEPIRPFGASYPSAYPRNIFGETPHTAMANQITNLVQLRFGSDYVTAHTVVGENGQPLAVIAKGATDTGTAGRAYAATLFEVLAIKRLASEAGKTYGVSAFFLTHGENDAANASYGQELYELWSDYNDDIRTITGQSKTIPMFVSQHHSVPGEAGLRSASTLAQWRAGVEHPGDIVCSGPKYQYPYVTDSTHLTTLGYDRLGEKYGQVYFERVVLGRDWQPLQPTRVQRNERVITVHFHVPAPPLVWDDSLPEPHQTGNSEWAAGRGFELWTSSSRIAIESVVITGNTVRITCASDPPATGLIVGYAMTSDGWPTPGRPTRWGKLRDSDPFVGALTGSAHPNYAVAFELEVP